MDHSLNVEPKKIMMREEKVNEIIATFADYVENYYDEEDGPEDVPAIVNEHFDEFIEWAYDDFVIGEEDQKSLQGKPDPEFRECIKREVIQEFLMILGVRKFFAASPEITHEK